MVICVIGLLVAPELAPGGTQPAHTGTQPAHTVDWRPWRQSGPTSAPPNTQPELVRLFAL